MATAQSKRIMLASVTLLAVAACGGVAQSPVAPSPTAPFIPSPPPIVPPAGPHFALELQSQSNMPVSAGSAWLGLVTVAANPAILRPNMPATVTIGCGAEMKAVHGFTSGTAPFSCLLGEGTHTITARATMASGIVYATGMSVAILPAPVPTPTPTPIPEPTPRPPTPRPQPPAQTLTVQLVALELHKNKTEATWRFSVDVTNGTLDDATFDFGAGSNCGGPGCTIIQDEDDYVDVEYKIAGTKDVRVAATVDGNTIRASKAIVVTFAP